ncbi:hypothetical protein ACQP1G_00055 [Nocardia sp. CA-107356]|uniref:hypothetical protein n=1 Tax=Nocardia sp. CA-107356 TaxID=3239972 RepID=UPI003D8A36DA
MSVNNPCIRHRKDDSTYSQVRHRIPCGGRTVATSQSFDDHAVAVRWYKLFENVGPVEAERNPAVRTAAHAAELVTLTGWLRRYADRLTGVEPETRKRYHRYIDDDVAGFYGEGMPLDAVTQDTAAEWVVWLRRSATRRRRSRTNMDS